MKKMTTLAIVAVTLSTVATSAFAFDRPDGPPPPGISEADRPMPPMMRRPNPVIQALMYMELSSDQRAALKLLEAQMREKMYNLKASESTESEEILSALDETGFNVDTFTKILGTKCAKVNAIRATYIKEIIALLTPKQIETLKKQLTQKPNYNLGY